MKISSSSNPKPIGDNVFEELKIRNSSIEVFKRELKKEKEKNDALKEQKNAFELQLRSQLDEIQKLKENDAKKNKILNEAKIMFGELNSEKDKLATEKAQIITEVKKLRQQNEELAELFNHQKSEQNEIKQQFFVCQEELERAVQLASGFRQEIDNQEKVNSDLVNQISIERKDRANEQASLEQLGSENKKLMKDLEKLSQELQSVEAQKETIVQEKNNIVIKMDLERQQLISERNKLKEDLQKQVKLNEESLHDFYLKQMESILSEKVEALQQYVKVKLGSIYVILEFRSCAKLISACLFLCKGMGEKNNR